jgi:hypothetical protein
LRQIALSKCLAFHYSHIHRDSLSAARGTPPKVQSVLEARLAQLSPAARKLAALAATIGREFDFSLLVKASGQNEDQLVHELDELWQWRIIREHGAESYDFYHDKLRETAYLSQSLVRRRLLHQRVAHALEEIHGSQLANISRQLAVHYEQASQPVQAIPFYLLAAQAARQVYANQQAIDLLQHGLELSTQIDLAANAAANKIVARIFEELGDVHELIAQHEEALHAYHHAQSRLHTQDHIGLARLHCKMGIALREQRRYLEALEACRQAENVLGKQPLVEDIRWWDQWLESQIEQVWAYYWLAQWPAMEELVNKIGSDVQAHGSPSNRMRYLMGSCLLHLRKERYVVSDEMISNTHEALGLSRNWGSLKNQLECQFEVGFLHLWRHELQEAGEHLHAALQLAETAGIAPMLTLTLTYLTVLARFRGQLDDVERYAQRAQQAALAAHMPDYTAAAYGNQAWLACRMGDWSMVERKAQEALGNWQKSPLVYPFQWQAIWPLMSVAMARHHENRVRFYASALLEPTQQLLPLELHTRLDSFWIANQEGRSSDASQQINCAMQLARQMGYL